LPKVVVENSENVTTKTQSFTAIPYYAWANRGEGEMMLWLPRKVTQVVLVAKD
jgi:DUF1680 family protein